jgi:hypothetical protein
MERDSLEHTLISEGGEGRFLSLLKIRQPDLGTPSHLFQRRTTVVDWDQPVVYFREPKIRSSVGVREGIALYRYSINFVLITHIYG